ncbi:TIGR02678 family protein [Modestobacter sp. VKM Ac-2979]|uniref:TIGR02678 family protein n=1 Tax=unclassified Modestobacter TaxID=2643866 RepID=UPI0022AB57E6|nr:MULTISPECIES: TIGR02678 family protein [unclassified Modestobacter]MCZ2810120.1 TIGR02678 family protein [Modestobacter sp. VKM Ac-2979]MCZ2841606.1 TIGR02678 family protein [Modestobacter sp. VKM Ac-2980]
MTTPIATREAAEKREAARALLRTPFLTAAADADALSLVRRHAPALVSMFNTQLGYRLVVEAGFARLVKAPLSADAPPRPARRSTTSGGDFGPRTYTYLTLLCASLLAPDTGEQVLVGPLVEQLRADAASAGVTLEDSQAEQRHLVAAFRLLITWGVLEETEGTVTAWGDRHEEALLSVHRPALPYLLTRPLAGLDAPGALLGGDPDAVEQPRRSLRRKLVENPLVRREDLTDGERDALSRDRTDLARSLEEHLGLLLEVRAEGALAYDPDREVTDTEFPGQGRARQAALLTVDELLRRHEPRGGTTATIDGRTVPGQLCVWDEVDEVIADLAAQHGKAWGPDWAADTAGLRAEVVDLLTALSLATAPADGLVLHPATARHRATVEAPPRTRAQTRLGNETLSDLTLFEETP